jgi:hypothetical protein
MTAPVLLDLYGRPLPRTLDHGVDADKYIRFFNTVGTLWSRIAEGKRRDG